MITTQQQLKVSDMQIDSLVRQKTHANLVEKEISVLPEGTRTYEGVGRMQVTYLLNYLLRMVALPTIISILQYLSISYSVSKLH